MFSPQSVTLSFYPGSTSYIDKKLSMTIKNISVKFPEKSPFVSSEPKLFKLNFILKLPNEIGFRILLYLFLKRYGKPIC